MSYLLIYRAGARFSPAPPPVDEDEVTILQDELADGVLNIAQGQQVPCVRVAKESGSLSARMIYRSTKETRTIAGLSLSIVEYTPGEFWVYVVCSDTAGAGSYTDFGVEAS